MGKVESPSDSEERKDVANTGHSYDPQLGGNGYDMDEFSDINETKLMAKIDLRLIPSLSIMYLLAFLDRTNIANAAVYGLQEELGIVPQGNEYNLALTLFFIPYVLFEIPSNVILKKLKPHVWLPLCMMGFGIVTVAQGLVTNVGGLYTTRFFLGLLETGMFPGAFYLIGMWYKRYEAQKRFSFFFASTSLAGAFGGLIAYAINGIDGALGHRAWRWIFIIEGAITMAFAVLLYFGIPDFPENVKFLTEKEKRFITARLREDQGNSGLERKITFKDVGNCFKDWKIIIGGFMYMGLIVPAYGYAYFSPTIIRTFGYTPVQTQLHSVPPWAASFGWSMVLAFFSDLARHRYAFIMGSMCISIVGFGILLSDLGSSVKYAALHLVTCGVYGSMPIIVCWYNLNLGGHHRRAIGSAWQIGFGNIGGIIATYSFLAKDAPQYFPGYGISLGFVGLAFLTCTLYFIGIVRENKKRNTTTDVGLTEHEKMELGDNSPDYRYML